MHQSSKEANNKHYQLVLSFLNVLNCIFYSLERFPSSRLELTGSSVCCTTHSDVTHSSASHMHVTYQMSDLHPTPQPNPTIRHTQHPCSNTTGPKVSTPTCLFACLCNISTFLDFSVLTQSNNYNQFYHSQEPGTLSRLNIYNLVHI